MFGTVQLKVAGLQNGPLGAAVTDERPAAEPAPIGDSSRVRCGNAATLCGRRHQAFTGPSATARAQGDASSRQTCGLAPCSMAPPALGCGQDAARLELIRRLARRRTTPNWPRETGPAYYLPAPARRATSAQRLRCARGPGDSMPGPGSRRTGVRPRQGVCVMSVPGTEPAQAAERAATAAPRKADRWDDPRLPWHGKPRAADILCWLGIALSGLFYWALLPLRLSLVGTHPVVAELLNGGTESIIS